MGPGLTETFETPDYLAEAGIEYVADYPMDDQPFDIRTKHGTLTSIPYTVELNDIPMMLIQHHKAAEFYDQCMEALERLDRKGERNARVMAIAVHPTFPVRRFASSISRRCWTRSRAPAMPSSGREATFWTGIWPRPAARPRRTIERVDWGRRAARGALNGPHDNPAQ